MPPKITLICTVALFGFASVTALVGCATEKPGSQSATVTTKGSKTKNLTVYSVDPSTVKQNSESDITVKGANFVPKSWVVVEGHFLKTKYVSQSELIGALTKQATGTTGKKAVKVHDANGDLSNAVTLTVE